MKLKYPDAKKKNRTANIQHIQSKEDNLKTKRLYNSTILTKPEHLSPLLEDVASPHSTTASPPCSHCREKQGKRQHISEKQNVGMK